MGSIICCKELTLKLINAFLPSLSAHDSWIWVLFFFLFVLVFVCLYVCCFKDQGKVVARKKEKEGNPKLAK